MGELALAIQPHVLAWRMPNTKSARPNAESPAPTQSIFGAGLGPSTSTIQPTAATIRRAKITSPTKTYRQSALVVTQPPRMGPTAIPAPATPPITP